MANTGSYTLSAGSFLAPRLDWRSAYEQVLAEDDTYRLFKLVEIAEACGLMRQDELDDRADHHSERQALQKALADLLVVKRKRLKFL